MVYSLENVDYNPNQRKKDENKAGLLLKAIWLLFDVDNKGIGINISWYTSWIM